MLSLFKVFSIPKADIVCFVDLSTTFTEDLSLVEEVVEPIGLNPILGVGLEPAELTTSLCFPFRLGISMEEDILVFYNATRARCLPREGGCRHEAVARANVSRPPDVSLLKPRLVQERTVWCGLCGFGCRCSG